MRIIAGRYKNRTIRTPLNNTTRPILTRVRKSLFDILQPYLKEARILDLFSGTGIMALEAISRGASFAYSIDADSHAVSIAKQNHQKICPDTPYRIMQGNVLEWIPRLVVQEEPFDIIGITPPYGEKLADKTLDKLEQHPDWLKEETVIYVQRDQAESIQVNRTLFEHVRTKKYGRTIVEFFLPYG